VNEAPRPDPDALLRLVARQGNDGARGRLKVFLGAAPGVGKTCKMLEEGAARRAAGSDVAIGVVETHGRAETLARTTGFEVIPRARIDHRGQALEEMDLDAILARHPALVLVDELAHTNAPGSRHDKRWQDVDELLDAGIDVLSTLNIQHLESLNDVVASFTHVRVRETLPDRVLDEAEIEVVDLPPDALIERLREGKVYIPEEASRALTHFFSKSNLSALRELALRRAAQTVDAQMLDLVRAQALAGNWAAGERIVVALSDDPGGEEVVRTARRMADALRAPWTAVHVETPRDAHLSPAQHARLAAHLELAATLGARIASVPALDVATGLLTVLAETRATQLVLGKAPRSRWHQWRHGSVVDQMVRGTPGVAVHVLGLAGAAPLREPLRPRGWLTRRWGTPLGYVVSLGLVALVTLVGVSIASFGNITNIALLYLVPVLVAATRYGLRTGVVTGIAGSLAYNFFFIPPIHTFTIADPQNLITVFVLLGVAVLVSQMAARSRDQALMAERSAAQNRALAGFARLIAGETTAAAVGQVLCAEAAQLLDVRAVLLLPEDGALVLRAAIPPEDTLTTLEHAAARWAFDRMRPAGRGSDTLTASDWLFSPVAVGGRPLGVFGIAREDAAAPVRADQRPLLASLIDQAALSLERIAAEAEMAEVGQLREADRLRSALLSSVSHDLRTPLTAIIGTLADMAPATPAQTTQIATARAEAERLNRFVANLLDMVRIEAGALTRTGEAVDIAEAVASAVHDLKPQLAGRPVRLDVSPELPFVVVDPQLFHHCLLNLIDNAAKYGATGAPVTIAARRIPGGLALSVIDQGPGLPPGSEARIFETFARFEGSDRRGGTGLGLAIVKGFAEAMGLTVSAANRSDNTAGAVFTLHFDEAHLRRSDIDPEDA